MGKWQIGVVFTLAAASAALAQEPAAPQGPEAYFKLDETTGTTATDSVSGTLVGNYTGTPTPTASSPVPPITYKDPECLSFNGSNQCVTIPSFGNWTKMSISAWVNRSGTTGTRQSIVSYKEGNGVNQGFVLSLNENGSSEYPRIFVQVNGSWNFAEQAVAVPTGSWTHLVGTYDGTTIRLYVNGAPAASSSAAGTMTNTGSQYCCIGARADSTLYTYPGLIDGVRFYSRALSDNEVAVLAAGCPTPTGLAAAAGANQVTLNWTAPTGVDPGYTYQVKRAGVAGGPYTSLGAPVSGTTFTDSGLMAGTTYYYVVSAISAAESGNSAEVYCRPPEVSALPNTGLQTTEAGGTATFNVSFNAPAPAGGSTITVSSTNTVSGGLVSSATNPTPVPSITISVLAGFVGVIPITVTGVDDFVVTPNTAYTVTVSVTGFSLVIPDVQLTNLERDTLGILVSKNSVTTTTAGGQDSFSVSLNSQPVPNSAVTIAVTSSNTSEATVSPATLTFTPGNWNIAQPVTVTGVGVNLTYLNTPFTVSLTVESSPPAPASPAPDPAYVGLTSPPAGPIVVSGTNLHLEVPPALPRVWGGSSGGGGCGLLGLEWGLPLVAVTLGRRRRRRR
jgi:hypothetical protein